MKVAGVEPSMMEFEGVAVVYESQKKRWPVSSAERSRTATSSSSAMRGRAVVPAMQEMLSPTSAIAGAGIRAALITDGGSPEAARAFASATSAPEAAAGGPIAAVENGDPHLHQCQYAHRRTESRRRRDTPAPRALPPFEPKVKRGWLARYLRYVTSADTGAVFEI